MRTLLLILSALCVAAPVGASEFTEAKAKARAVGRGRFSPGRLPKGVKTVDAVNGRLTFKDGSRVYFGIDYDRPYEALAISVTKPVPGKQAVTHMFEADLSGPKVKLRFLPGKAD